MLYFLYRLGRFLTLHLPLGFSYGLATFISSIYSFISRVDNEAVKANLKVLFPEYDDKKLGGMAREIYINFGKYLVDFFRFSLVGKDYIDKYIRFEGFDFLKDALGKDKGVILLSAHIGNWELGGVVLPVMDIPFASVALDHKDKNINSFFMRQREITGGEVIGTSSSLKKCITALKDSKTLALVGDRDYFDNGITVDFFGKETSLPKGPAVFSRRMHSPIVPTFMIRNDDDTFTFKFLKPIEPIITNNEHEDLKNMTIKIARVMEGVIRENSTQWHVFRRFWEPISWERLA